jgi:hypothetical protein
MSVNPNCLFLPLITQQTRASNFWVKSSNDLRIHTAFFSHNLSPSVLKYLTGSKSISHPKEKNQHFRLLFWATKRSLSTLGCWAELTVLMLSEGFSPVILFLYRKLFSPVV